MADKLTEQEKEDLELAETTRSRTVRVLPAVQDLPRLCEESKEGHLVKVKLWPPKQRASMASRRTPSVAGVCVRCESHVIVYSPVQAGLEVLLPNGKKIKGVEPADVAS